MVKKKVMLEKNTAIDKYLNEYEKLSEIVASFSNKIS